MSYVLQLSLAVGAVSLLASVPVDAATTGDDTAVVTEVSAGKCEMHPMLLEQKTSPLTKGTGLDATDYVRCKNGGQATLKYAETGGTFVVKGDKWHVVGNAGAPLKEDLGQPRQGRTAKKEKPSDPSKLPS